MLGRKHKQSLQRLVAYTSGRRVLMLGNQSSELGDPQAFFDAGTYETIDPDGGDYRDSLTDDLPSLRQQYGAVVNIGTLEHIWDAHRAYCVAADMVHVGGYFIGHSPVSGYAMHGIHVTAWWSILRFFRQNGFRVETAWFTDRNGNDIRYQNDKPVILWFVARRVEAVAEWVAPQQTYKDGTKPRPEDYLREFAGVLR